jgi:hypothetical protein
VKLPRIISLSVHVLIRFYHQAAPVPALAYVSLRDELASAEGGRIGGSRCRCLVLRIFQPCLASAQRHPHLRAFPSQTGAAEAGVRHRTFLTTVGFNRPLHELIQLRTRAAKIHMSASEPHEVSPL